MIRCFILFMVLAFCSTVAADPPSDARRVSSEVAPILPAQWDETTRILLGRSCVGEAGFHAINECIAIAWVYVKRARTIGWPLKKVIRRYSAAVKPHSRHDRPWLFELNADGKRPESWPRHLSWPRHRAMWLDLLAEIDRWQAGEIKDPVPDADHYGSKQDARAARLVRRWRRIDTPGFRNWFFDSGA